MKRRKIEMEEGTNFLSVFKMIMGGYHFAPKQMIRFRMQNPVTKESTIMFGVIDSLSFEERHGDATPIAKVLFFNTWKDGETSGYLEMEFCPHRYYVGNPSEEEMELLKTLYEGNEEWLYCVDYVNQELIYPFAEEEKPLQEKEDTLVEVQCPDCGTYIVTETEAPELSDTYAKCLECEYEGDMMITKILMEGRNEK